MADVNVLNIGVIGVGGRGSLAHCAHRPEEGVYLKGGADVDKKNLIQFRNKFGSNVFTTTDYRELLNRPEINAVFITTPDFLHEEHAVAALKAGKAVYLEKPLAITVEGCDRILQAAVENNSKLYVGHNMRHMTLIKKMKQIIDSGAIGKIKTAWCRHFISYGGDAYFKDWHADRRKSTGLLLQKGAHDIDVLHWLCGGYSTRVTAMGGLTLYGTIMDRHATEERGDNTFRDENWPPLSQKGLNPVMDIEDISMMLMELDNGVFASYQQCHYAPDAWRNYTFIGTQGRIENFGDEPGNCSIRIWNRRAAFKPDGDEQLFIPPEAGTHGGADNKIVSEFIDFLKKRTAPTTSPVAARYSVAAGYFATESLRELGIPKLIPPLSEKLMNYFKHQSDDKSPFL